MHAAVNIERFPEWRPHPKPRKARPSADWVALGSEYDIAHISRLWQQIIRFRLDQLPDDESIMWQLADALRGRRSDAVMIHEAIVSIQRCHLAAFREAIDWLWDHLNEEHGDHMYRWSRDVGDYTRIETEQSAITELEDARRAVDIIDTLMDVAADNVVYLREDA